MKGGTLQITWHGSDPVLTLDFHCLSGLLATGGADHDIKFWTLCEADNVSLPSATFHSSLSYHTAAVNVVRFSAAGDQLASGADGGEILLWRLTENPEASSMWKLAKNLRFHVKDVLDLQWSSDGTLLISGSVDNTVIIWDIVKGNPQQVLKDHMHYVQGVAWDPIGQYIASISGDRTCRIYSNKPPNPRGKNQDRHNFSCQSVLVKAELPKQEDEATKVAAAKLNLFHDETLPSFFRRLSWSPDGSFLLVPAGIHKFPSESVLTNTAFLISRKDLSRPSVQLPGASKPVVAVRFCPMMFSCYPNSEQKSDKDSNDTGVFKLPYRLVFAVATLNSLFVYDTQSVHPLAVLAGIHYAAITDIAWSCNGKFLAVSSQDGFCTLVVFGQEELGSPLPLSELPPYVAKILPPGKDKMAGLYARSFESATKAKSKGDCNGHSAKKVDVQSDSTVLAVDKLRYCQGHSSKQATHLHCNGEEQAHVAESIADAARFKEVTVSEKQDQEASASSELSRQPSASHGKPHLNSQHADCTDKSANTNDRLASQTTGCKDLQRSPKKSRRITPVAILDVLSQQGHEANVSSGSPGMSLQPDQEANASLESIPKKPRRITPVAILGAPPMQDHESKASIVNSSTPLQPYNEAQASSILVMQASAPPVEPHQESQHVDCIDATNSKACMVSDSDKIENLQSIPKKPRRITPVAITESFDTPQMTDASKIDTN